MNLKICKNLLQVIKSLRLKVVCRNTPIDRALIKTGSGSGIKTLECFPHGQIASSPPLS